MNSYLAVALGGALGSMLRFGVSQGMQGWGRGFPYATFLINITGSFLMGFLFILTLERIPVDPVLRVGILTGILGGYTTFSTFSMEGLTLLESGALLRAGLYILGSVLLGLFGAWLGVLAARHL